MTRVNRRQFLSTSTSALLGVSVAASAAADTQTTQKGAEPIIDIHQHLGYSGRPDDVLLAHQKAMGVTTTVLLPSGRPVMRKSTHNGVANGLQAEALGNDACHQFVQVQTQAHRERYLFGANEVPDLDDATKTIEANLKRGAVLIGEQKFGVECDSPEMQRIYQLARAHGVPVLLHFQFEMYNYGFERFHKMLAKYSKVRFIGHAQTWWANIDKNHTDQKVLYPKGPVTPGGMTDRYLRDYENMYGDLSAGSGLNALTRDEAHAREFLARHQDKLLFGSDCNDREGGGPKCQGTQTIAAIRRLSASTSIERKLLHDNARKLFRL
jgi:predicted TIM-barrel fold metal-dependent hydrolase